MINNGYNIGNFSSYISLNHDRTDGHRPDSKFHITNGFAKLGYKIDDHYKVTGDVSLAKFKNQNPGEITNTGLCTSSRLIMLAGNDIHDTSHSVRTV